MTVAGGLFRPESWYQAILALDPDADHIRDIVQGFVEDFAARGFRSLGVARTDSGGKYRVIGVLPLFDPVREDSKETIQAVRDMGVDVKMVTGDHAAIAREVARELSLGDSVLEAAALETTRPLLAR